MFYIYLLNRFLVKALTVLTFTVLDNQFVQDMMWTFKINC